MRKLSKKQLILTSVVLVVIVLSALAGYLLSRTKIKTSSPGSSGVTLEKDVEEASDVTKTAEALAFEGDVDNAIKELDKAIEETDNTTKKKIYQSGKATILLNNNNLDASIAAAIEAFNLSPDKESAALVGQIAKDKDDSKTSIEYYKRAIELIDKDDPYHDEDAEYYGGIIKDLESGDK